MATDRHYVYFNLHRHDWSDMVRGKVQGHHKGIVARDVTFRVRPAGHAKVLAEGRKNVHAFAISDCILPCNPPPIEGEEWIEVSYNPYRGASFYRKDTGEDIAGAEVAFLTPDKKVFAKGLRQ